MFRLSSTTLCIVALSTLAACGGGGGGGGGGGTDPTIYTTFETRGQLVTSNLGGRLIISGPDAEIREISALLAHNTGNLTNFTGGSGTLNDTNGDEDGTWQSGGVTLQQNAGQTGTYDFVAFYNLIDPSGDSGPLVIGVTMNSDDVPIDNPGTGNVLFSGEAFINGSTTSPGQASLSATGTSEITVNFANDTASVLIANLNGPSGLQYSSIQINNLVFGTDRSTFAGNGVSLFSGNIDVTEALLGSGATFDAQGDFYGEENGYPAEVGGVFVSENATGQIFGGFIGK